MKIKIKRGDIINADLNPVVGSETGKIRPCLVISNDIQNKYSPIIIIAVITEWNIKKEKIPICVVIEDFEKLNKKSIIDCGQIRTISKSRIKGKILGRINAETIKKVNNALSISLCL